MKTPRFYLDTSVLGGCFDPEFEKASRLLFERCKHGNFIILLSNIAFEELQEAPQNVKSLPHALTEHSLEVIQESLESVQLAEAYLAAGIVPGNFYDDCRHVALASVCQADALISWNFRHIVRLDKIKAFNAVNLLSGYPPLEIRSPLEVSFYDK